MELHSDNETDTLTLNNLPSELKFSFMKNIYSLVGIINFKSTKQTTRQSTDEIGHYTAICHRRNTNWIQYDDCKEAESRLNTNYSICPHIVMYSI